MDWRQGLPVLRVRDASLREPVLADGAGLFARLTTPSVVKFLSTPPDSSEGFERFIAWMQHERELGRHVCYAIVPAHSPDPVGLIQVREIGPGFETAEWGFALDEALWGTGLFLPCARAVVDFVFRHVGVKRLEARAVAGNSRAHGVLRKLGAVEEGCLRQSFLLGGQYHDDVLWSILDTDWSTRGVRHAPIPRP
jgi:ribosomal-protein-alanine N-acetyltransferase